MRTVIFKYKAMFAILAAVIICLSACQPTPEVPIVVGKEQGKMLEAAKQTPSGAQPVSLSEQVSAPDKYAADIALADGKMTIKAAAPVILPDVKGLPTLRVQAADFTQQQVDGMIAALFKGQKIYEMQYGPETKDEIAAHIVHLEKMKVSDEYSSEGDQEQLEEEINRLKQQYETAPETSEDITTESDGQLRQMEIKDEDGKHMAYYMGLDVSTYSDPDDYEQGANLQVRNNNDMKEAVFEGHGGGVMMLRRCATLDYRDAANLAFTNWGQHTPIQVDEHTVIEDSKVLAKLKMTPAQAKEAAEKMLKEAGIDYMSVRAMCLVDDENLGNYDGIVSPAENYAYRIFLRRMSGGVPCAYIRGSTSSGGGTNVIDEALKQKSEGGTMDVSGFKYVGEWEYETMEIVMNDQGVITLDWMSPLTVGETVVENSALLPFERITAAFEQRMRDKYEPQAKEDFIASMNFSVDYVSLELQRIAEQDSLDTGLLVPVWNFYGTETDGYNDQGNATTNENGFNEPRPILSVNAINASVIDNDIGY